MIKITLSNQTTFTSQESESILDAALAAKKVLEHSCRTGRCGICRTKLISGTTEILQPESALSAEEVRQNTILTCCRQATSDIELDCEDLSQFSDIVAKTVPCRIASLSKLTDNILQVRLRLPPNHSFHYISGQYIDVIGKNSLRRSYSIANAPSDEGHIELHIREVKQGGMSQYWFYQAKEGDLLRFYGPQGTFALRDGDQSHIILLATGTGIAPIKAMLEQINLQPERLEGKTVHLYWGGRTKRDIYWQPPQTAVQCHFHPVLSRADSDWSGRAGYIQQAVIADSIDLTTATVYACGSEAMIHSARKTLTEAGLPPKQFYSDAFVSSAK